MENHFTHDAKYLPPKGLGANYLNSPPKGLVVVAALVAVVAPVAVVAVVAHLGEPLDA